MGWHFNKPDMRYSPMLNELVEKTQQQFNELAANIMANTGCRWVSARWATPYYSNGKLRAEFTPMYTDPPYPGAGLVWDTNGD